MMRVPAGQKCPLCGQQPMSRLQYMMVPGMRSKCRKCGARIRIHLTRAQLLLLIGGSALIGGSIAAWADGVLDYAVGIAVALVAVLGFDEWAWRTTPWLPDQRGQPGEAPAPNPRDPGAGL